MLYTSKEFLHTAMGLDMEIAAFFVDRPVPPGNLYWKDRYLYVSKGKGFLFIPLFFDLMFKAGVGKDVILQEDFVQLTEDILHIAALQETGQITLDEQVSACKELLENKVVNLNLYTDLTQYFSHYTTPYNYLGTFSQALNRGDTYLFALCSISVSPDMLSRILECWYALVPSFLLMDDVVDLKDDQARNEENSIDDFGSGRAGVRNAISFLQEKIRVLKEANPKLGTWFENNLAKKMRTPYLHALLND